MAWEPALTGRTSADDKNIDIATGPSSAAVDSNALGHIVPAVTAHVDTSRAAAFRFALQFKVGIEKTMFNLQDRSSADVF